MFEKAYVIYADGTEADITYELKLADERWVGSFYEKVELLIKTCKGVNIRFE